MKTKKWIEWVEPYGPNSEPVFLRVSEKTAIAVQKYKESQNGYTYKNDKQALDDFIICNWAYYIEL
jgi:hypothetical protein